MDILNILNLRNKKMITRHVSITDQEKISIMFNVQKSLYQKKMYTVHQKKADIICLA